MKNIFNFFKRFYLKYKKTHIVVLFLLLSLAVVNVYYAKSHPVNKARALAGDPWGVIPGSFTINTSNINIGYGGGDYSNFTGVSVDVNPYFLTSLANNHQDLRVEICYFNKDSSHTDFLYSCITSPWASDLNTGGAASQWQTYHTKSTGDDGESFVPGNWSGWTWPGGKDNLPSYGEIAYQTRTLPNPLGTLSNVQLGIELAEDNPGTEVNNSDTKGVTGYFTDSWCSEVFTPLGGGESPYAYAHTYEDNCAPSDSSVTPDEVRVYMNASYSANTVVMSSTDFPSTITLNAGQTINNGKINVKNTGAAWLTTPQWQPYDLSAGTSTSGGCETNVNPALSGGPFIDAPKTHPDLSSNPPYETQPDVYSCTTPVQDVMPSGVAAGTGLTLAHTENASTSDHATTLAVVPYTALNSFIATYITGFYTQYCQGNQYGSPTCGGMYHDPSSYANETGVGMSIPVNSTGTFVVPSFTAPMTPGVYKETWTLGGNYIGGSYTSTITVVPNNYTVGGTVSGLSGSVVLQDNAGDNLTVNNNGAFTFATSRATGQGYAVSVYSNPATQVCTVSSGSGTMGTSNVTNVKVTCSARTYSVGGIISGLSGSIVLTDGIETLTLNANGSFTFPTSIAMGATYAVTVITQPSGQTCSVTNGSGAMGGSNVTNVNISCGNLKYTVSGTISGLSGTVVLQDNGGDNLTMNTNGVFTFATPIATGSTFAVTVSSQPSGQTCTVLNGGSRTMGSGNVNDIGVHCINNAYAVAGTISGPPGIVVLQDNGGDNLSVSISSGTFAFATLINTGSGYNVTVLTQPSGETCVVSNGSGTMGTGNVTNVSVSCTSNASTIAVSTNLPNNGNSLYGALNNTSWGFNALNATDPCATSSCADVTSGNYTATLTSGNSTAMGWVVDYPRYTLNGVHQPNPTGGWPIGYRRNLTKTPATALAPFSFYLSRLIHVADADDCGGSSVCTINAFTNGDAVSYSGTYTPEVCAINLNYVLNGSSTPVYGSTYTVVGGTNSYSGTFTSSSTQATSSAPTDATNPATYTITVPETFTSNGATYDVDSITGYSVQDPSQNTTTNYSTSGNQFINGNTSATAGFSCNYDPANDALTPAQVETTTVNISVQPRAGIQVK